MASLRIFEAMLVGELQPIQEKPKEAKIIQPQLDSTWKKWAQISPRDVLLDPKARAISNGLLYHHVLRTVGLTKPD